jgi:hypothetical protein
MWYNTVQMWKNLISKLGQLIFRLLFWYTEKVHLSWTTKTRKVKKRKNGWFRIIVYILFNSILFMILTEEAFKIGFLLGMSFIWSSFIAISFAYVLNNPLVIVLVFVGVVLGREIIPVFYSAKTEVVNGNIIGALIVFALGIVLLIWANRLKKGELD